MRIYKDGEFIGLFQNDRPNFGIIYWNLDCSDHYFGQKLCSAVVINESGCRSYDKTTWANLRSASPTFFARCEKSRGGDGLITEDSNNNFTGFYWSTDLVFYVNCVTGELDGYMSFSFGENDKLDAGSVLID